MMDALDVRAQQAAAVDVEEVVAAALRVQPVGSARAP